MDRRASGLRRVQTNVTPNATITPTPGPQWPSRATRNSCGRASPAVPTTPTPSSATAARPPTPWQPRPSACGRAAGSSSTRIPAETERPACRPPTARPRRAQAGLTLIELLVSMIILGIITTMLIAGWINLQRGSAFAVTTNNARGDGARLDQSRRERASGAPSPRRCRRPHPTATATPAAQPPHHAMRGPERRAVLLGVQRPLIAAADGTGVAPLRLTRIYLDTSTGTSLAAARRSYLGGTRTSRASGRPEDTAGEERREQDHRTRPDQRSAPPTRRSSGTRIGPTRAPPCSGPTTPRDAESGDHRRHPRPVIIDANIAHTPKFIDATTTVRLRNASGS